MILLLFYFLLSILQIILGHFFNIFFYLKAKMYFALDYFYSCSDGVPLSTQYYELQKCIPSTYGEYMKYSTVTSDGEIRLVAEYYPDVDCQDILY